MVDVVVVVVAAVVIDVVLLSFFFFWSCSCCSFVELLCVVSAIYILFAFLLLSFGQNFQPDNDQIPLNDRRF